jgi:SAM-dependent methyltransferase
MPPSLRFFDSEAEWPGFQSLGNYLPKPDIGALRLALKMSAAPGKTYLEVGSFTGTTAIIACKAGYETVLGVDTWAGGSDPADWINGFYRETGDLAYQTFLQNTAGYPIAPLRMSSLEASKRFSDGSLDVVFLDGDHSYELTLQDVQAWLPKVKAGGFLCGHDYGIPEFPGVSLAVDKILGKENITICGSVWFYFTPNPTGSPCQPR